MQQRRDWGPRCASYPRNITNKNDTILKGGSAYDGIGVGKVLDGESPLLHQIRVLLHLCQEGLEVSGEIGNTAALEEGLNLKKKKVGKVVSLRHPSRLRRFFVMVIVKH